MSTANVGLEGILRRGHGVGFSFRKSGLESGLNPKPPGFYPGKARWLRNFFVKISSGGELGVRD